MVRAFAIRECLLQDLVGPRTVPILVGGGAVVALRPTPGPRWSRAATLGRLFIATAIATAFVCTLKPLGFVAPGVAASSALTCKITPNLHAAVAAGQEPAIGRYVLVRYVLGSSPPAPSGGLR